MLLAQIASRRTQHLIRSLLKWPVEDLVAFLSEVLSISRFSKERSVFCTYSYSYLISVDSFLDRRLADAYLSALIDEPHPCLPVIAFVTHVARLTDNAFIAVLGAGFLESILWLYNRALYPPHRGEYNIRSRNAVACACNLAFSGLNRPPEDLQLLWDSRLQQFWLAEEPPSSLPELIKHINTHDPATWTVLEARFLERQVDGILKVVNSCPLYPGRSIVDDVYPRAKDFVLRSEMAEPMM